MKEKETEYYLFVILFLKQFGNLEQKTKDFVYIRLNRIDDHGPCKQRADSSEAPEPEHVEQFKAKFTTMM